MKLGSNDFFEKLYPNSIFFIRNELMLRNHQVELRWLLLFLKLVRRGQKTSCEGFSAVQRSV